MDPRLGLYELFLVLSMVVSSAVAVYAWRRGNDTDGAFLAMVLVGSVGWSASSLVGSLAPGGYLALTAARSVYLFVPVVVAGLFLFTLSYTGRQGLLRPRLYAALAVEPVLLAVAVWTNDANVAFLDGGHALFWTSVELSPVARIGWSVSRGPLFWAHSVYSYLLLFIATVWLAQFALRAERLYQRQMFAIMVSLLAPWLSNMAGLIGAVPVDPTPIGFAITGVGLTWAIVQTRFLEIAPIARDAVVETIVDGVIVLDTDETVVDSNPAARELFDRQSIVGESVDSLLAENLSLRDRIHRLLTDEQTSAEVEVDGRHYTVEVTPLTARGGEPLGQVLLIHDVTKQKERQHALERRNEQLDRFTSVVSHDLRNPLQVSSSALELARETGDPDYFDRAEEAHERMAYLIKDLLTLAKRGEVLADVSETSLEALAREAWRTVDTADATLQIEADRPIHADPDRLQQLFENLYRNAVEHVGSDVTITVRQTATGFDVVDNGPGMPEHIQESVATDGRTVAADGTGIGLMIVKHVAEAHGWTLSIDTDDGGTRFAISEE